ncbi:MAG: glycerol-3-phosphate 1-O-acyltransferase PlsY [Pseudomonadota bacterium]
MPEIVSPFLPLFSAAVGGYLLGSVPFGIVMARLFGLGDLRQIGSGNIGATNVLRTGNKPAAALTLILDAAKGGVAVLIARALFADDAAQIAGFCAFLGHLYPVWLGFKGGKGVATFLGTLAALSLPLGVIACALWLLTAAVMRFSSLSALVAAAGTPVVALLIGRVDLVLVTVLMAALVYYRHGENIARLRTGTEPKIGASKP